MTITDSHDCDLELPGLSSHYRSTNTVVGPHILSWTVANLLLVNPEV